VRNSWLCYAYQVHRVDPYPTSAGFSWREECIQDSRSMQPRIENAHLLITHVLDSCVKLLAERLSVLFPVNPRPDGGVPVNRHNKSPIYVTRALIRRALVLMTFNPFERVAVSLKLVSMLLHYSSPPASLVFAVFSCEQILKRPSRIEFEL